MVLLAQVALVDFLEFQVIQATAVLVFQDIVVGQEYREQMVCQDFLELADIVEVVYLAILDSQDFQVTLDFQELVDFQGFQVTLDQDFQVTLEFQAIQDFLVYLATQEVEYLAIVVQVFLVILVLV